MKTLRSALLAFVPAAFVAVFFAYPVATLLARGFGLDAGRLLEVITGSRFLKIIWFTTWQAALSTLLAGVVALPLTWALANRQFVGRRLARVLVTVPFVLPTVVVAGAFIALMDRFNLDQGAVRLRHTVWAILLAHAFFNVAVFARSVGGFWSQLDRRPEEAARTLGASPWRAFVEVTLPRLRPSVIAAVSVVFLFSFTSFAVILLLGGPRRSTYRNRDLSVCGHPNRHLDRSRVVDRADGRRGIAGRCEWMVTAQSCRPAGFGRRPGAVPHRRRRQRGGVVRDTVPAPRSCSGCRSRCWSSGRWRAVVVTRSRTTGRSASGCGFCRSAPQTHSSTRCRSPSWPLVSPDHRRYGVAGHRARHSIVSRVLDLGMLLPLGTSAVTLGFGVLIALDRGVLDLRGSWWIVPITQSLIAIPVCGARRRSRAASNRSGHPRGCCHPGGVPCARPCARSICRIGARALATGVGFAFAISLGEFGATSFVGRRSDLLTVPLAIQRLLATPGDLLRGQAMALSVILMMVTALVVFIGDRLHPKSGGLL